MGRPAVFLDRDGTLIEDTEYLSSPDEVRLLPGAAESLIRLRQAGYDLIVVSNQSGVARGMFTEEAVRRVNDRMCSLLAQLGAALDDIKFCPYMPGREAKVERYRKDSEMRKPKPGMILEAAGERDIDLPTSWAIGDSRRDVQAGRAAGCRTILLNGSGRGKRPPEADFVAPTLVAATDRILGLAGDDAAEEEEPETPRSMDEQAREAPAVVSAANAAPAAPASGDAAGGGDARETNRLLREILELQQRQARLKAHSDFSFLQLAAAVVQVVAIAFAVFGFLEMLDGKEGDPLAAMLRILIAIFCQLFAMTLHTQARQR